MKDAGSPYLEIGVIEESIHVDVALGTTP